MRVFVSIIPYLSLILSSDLSHHLLDIPSSHHTFIVRDRWVEFSDYSDGIPDASRIPPEWYASSPSLPGFTSLVPPSFCHVLLYPSFLVINISIGMHGYIVLPIHLEEVHRYYIPFTTLSSLLSPLSSPLQLRCILLRGSD